MPEKKLTFGEALINITINEETREKGLAVFDQMLNRAISSHVPQEANAALIKLSKKIETMKRSNDSEEKYPLVASMLLEQDFTNPKLASYAVIYSQTMAVLKSWNEFDQMINAKSELHRKLTNALRRIKDPIKLRIAAKYALTIEGSLNETKPAFQEFSDLVTSSCGQLTMLEEMGKNGALYAIPTILFGIGYTEENLSETRSKVEEYFSNPSKISRIKLIANWGI